MNKITICGNLGKDPEVTTTNSGVEITRFSVAVHRKFKKEDGTYDVDFFNCTAFNKLGTEVIAKYAKKGSKVLVSGRMESNSKEDNGTKTMYWNLIVEDFELVGGNKNAVEEKTEPQPVQPIDEDSLPF